jgi:hypothetical protein
MEEIIRVRKIKHQDLTNYYISRDGIIFNNKYYEVAKTITNGYFIVKIKKKSYSVHRLVALTYLKNYNNNPVVNHIDENKLNNKVVNLEWVTQKENCNAHTKIISHEREVIQKDLEGKVIKVHNSITLAGQSIGLTRHAINKVCLGINKTAGGFKWEYKNYEYNYELNVNLTNAKEIIDFENYFIFPSGKIYNKQRKSFMKHCINAHGSHYITLSKNNKSNKYVHNLVATYFIDNPNNLTRVKHKDNNKNNNDYNNLEWF